ncbi:MAG: dihydrofolate reductase family protein [Saprospiraceae bacterium]|nr:dihydrofolate reductase family protein [Saprospiraceae bacterium]
MRKISAFLFLTINGFYKGLNDDISWHDHGEEGVAFSENQLKKENILLFGRKTYELMSSFWTSKLAFDYFPTVAKGMNNAEKMVLSTTLNSLIWQNTSILKNNPIEQLQQIKETPGKNITILGSGSVVTQLGEVMLIDEYQFLIDPIAIGKGTPCFENIHSKLELTLTESKIFQKSGSVLLTYNRK